MYVLFIGFRVFRGFPLSLSGDGVSFCGLQDWGVGGRMLRRGCARRGMKEALEWRTGCEAIDADPDDAGSGWGFQRCGRA